MRTEKLRAATSPEATAHTTESRRQQYRKPAPPSTQNLRENLTELLLLLQKPLGQDLQAMCWRRFETLLRRYVSLKKSEVGI